MVNTHGDAISKYTLCDNKIMKRTLSAKTVCTEMEVCECVPARACMHLQSRLRKLSMRRGNDDVPAYSSRGTLQKKLWIYFIFMDASPARIHTRRKYECTSTRYVVRIWASVCLSAGSRPVLCAYSIIIIYTSYYYIIYYVLYLAIPLVPES